MAFLGTQGCGGSVQPRFPDQSTLGEETEDLSSRDELDPEIETDAPLFCLPFADSNNVISARSAVFLTTLLEPRPDTTKLRIDRLDLGRVNYELAANPQRSVKFFTIRVDQAGAYINPDPIEFRFENTSNVSISGFQTSFSYSTLVNIASRNRISGSNATQLLSQMNLVLVNTGLQYDILRLQVYEGTQPVWHHDGLLPYIQANPNSYREGKNAASPRPDLLVQMHPYYSVMNTITDPMFFLEESRAMRNCF